MADTQKKRRKKYKLDTYDDIQVTLCDIFNKIARDEEDNYQKVNILAKLLDLRLKALKQNEMQIEIDKLNQQLEEWKANNNGGY